MFGLEIDNDYGDLLLSAMTTAYEFAGKAAYNRLEGFVSAYPQSWWDPKHGSWWLYYRIHHPYPHAPLAFVHKTDPGGDGFGVQSMKRLDASTWEVAIIYHNHGGTGPDHGGFDSSLPEVYCFRQTQPVSGGYGMELRTSAGALGFLVSTASGAKPLAVHSIAYLPKLSSLGLAKYSYSGGSYQDNVATATVSAPHPRTPPAKAAYLFSNLAIGIYNDPSSPYSNDIVGQGLFVGADLTVAWAWHGTLGGTRSDRVLNLLDMNTVLVLDAALYD